MTVCATIARADIDTLSPWPPLQSDAKTVEDLEEQISLLELVGGSGARQTNQSMRLRCQLGQLHGMAGNLSMALSKLSLCIDYFRDRRDNTALAEGKFLKALVYAKKNYMLTAKTLLDIHLLNSEAETIPRELILRIHALNLLLQLYLQQPESINNSLQVLNNVALVDTHPELSVKVLAIRALMASYQRKPTLVLSIMQEALEDAKTQKLRATIALWYRFELIHQRQLKKQENSGSRIQQSAFHPKFYRLFREVEIASRDDEELIDRDYFAVSLYQRLLLETYAHDLIERVSGDSNPDATVFSVEQLEKIRPYEIINSANNLLESDLTLSNRLREEARVREVTRINADNRQFTGIAVAALLILALLIALVLLRKQRENSRYEARIKTTRHQLEKHFRYDSLTKTYNSEWALQILTTEIEQKHRMKGKVSLMLLKIEGLALANLRKGRSFGDNVLCHFATDLKRSIRQQDFLARWSGDEFLLYCPDTDISGYQIVAEKILKDFWDPGLYSQDQALPLNVSVAIITVAEGEAFSEAISRLQDGLFQSAELGGGQIIFN